jgi:Flp pilus assembly pilin Flp
MSLHTIRQRFGSIASPNRQKGASALEYLVLAAAIIIVIGALAASDSGLGTIVSDAFEGIFTDAADTSGGGGG